MGRIYPDKINKAQAGKPYHPSNGTEGSMFEEIFCFKCTKFPISDTAKNQCGIWQRACAYFPSDKKYPKQWRYAPDGGGPECTSFRKRMTAFERRQMLRKHLTA